jgi:hypothetical protein
MALTHAEIRERAKSYVRRGATLLDERVVGWARRINERELNLSSCGKCILGQVYGEFERGIEILFGDDDLETWRESAGFGFFFDEEQYPHINEQWYYAALASAWLAEIRARLAPDPAPIDVTLPAMALVNCPEVMP